MPRRSERLEFLCSSPQTSIVHCTLEGGQSGIVSAASAIPRSPLLPVGQHGIQVTIRSCVEQSRSGLNDGELISCEAEALTNLPPLVNMLLQDAMNSAELLLWYGYKRGEEK